MIWYSYICKTESNGDGALSNELLADSKENGGGFRGVSIKTVDMNVNTTWIAFLRRSHDSIEHFRNIC